MVTHRLTAHYYLSQSLVNTHRLTAEDTLEDHLKSFLLHCKVKRLSPATLQNYAYQVGSFVMFAETNNITRLCDVNKVLIQLFMVALEEKNNGTSCKDYYKGIKRFFKWLIWDDVLEVNPMAKVEVPKEDTKIIQPFTIQQMNTMLTACNPKYPIGLRNRAMISVFYETAARLKEMACMKVADVDIDQQVIKVMGKGNKQRLVTISEKTVGLIFEYLHTRKKKSDWLWLSIFGEPLTTDGIYQVIAGLAEKVNIEGVRCSPHTFRHTRATQLLKDGVAQKFVQILLGHKDPRMIQRYVASLDSEQALQAIREKDTGGKLDV